MKPRPSIYIPELESYIDSSLVYKPNPVFAEMESYAKEKISPLSLLPPGLFYLIWYLLLGPNKFWN